MRERVFRSCETRREHLKASASRPLRLLGHLSLARQLLDDRIRQGGPGFLGPLVELAVRQATRPASGSIRRNVPEPPKWPNARGEVFVPIQVDGRVLI